MKKVILSIFIASIFIACKKTEEVKEKTTNYSSEQEFITAENDFNTVYNDVEDALNINSDDNTPGSKAIQNSCITDATVTIVNDSIVGSYDSYMEINFENGCGNFGTTQTGKILVFFSGRRIDGNFRDSVRFNGFGINGRNISGVKMVSQQNTSDADSWKFDVKVMNGLVKFNDGRTVTYNSDRTRVRTGLSTLLNFSDDQFIISGTANGENSNGDETTTTITQNIIIDGACTENFFRVPVSGEIEFRNVEKNIGRTINYGEGECDKNVSITANGYTFNWTVL